MHALGLSIGNTLGNYTSYASGDGVSPGILDTPPAIDWSHLSLVTAEYDNHAENNLLMPVKNGSIVSNGNLLTVTDTPADGTWFYGLTSEEYSNLASDAMSTIVRVEVAGGAIGDISFFDSVQDFWDTAPSAPTNFAVANKDGNNHYVATWTEPADTNDMIVGYNLYYDSTSNPAATQAKRIATVPKGYATWKDWCAVLAPKGKWGITSVDKWGNESTILYNDTTTGAAGSGRPTRPGGIPTRTSDNAGLTEIDTRRGRISAATWTAATMEDGTTFKWQPETLMFYDPDTGFECWKMTSSKGYQNIYHDDIGVSPWSANGAKMALHGASRTSQLYGGSQVGFDDWWMTVDTTGANFRPVNGIRRYGGNYFHWDPQVVGQYWEVGETHLGTGASTNQLSRTTVDTDGVCTTNVVVTLSAGSAGGIINKMIWPDGLQLVIENSSTVRWYPIDIAVDGTATQSDSDGYSMDRSYGTYGGHSGAAVVSYHDQYPGAPGWAFVLTNDSNGGTSTWWRQQVTGTAADGGPLYTGNDGNNDFGEIWPENHSTIDVGSTYSPWVAVPPSTYSATKTGYWSHFTADNWGQYALHSNVSDGTPAGAYGTGIWDVENHAWIVPSMGNQAQHHDWSGWCDSVVSSASTLALDYTEDKVLCATYNDSDSQYAVAFTHTRVLGGTAYNSLARPGQSPDGTKVAWHSEFLNVVDNVDCYWSVCYYPLPPTVIRASKSGGTITISFLPPKYTTRTWQAIPVYAREIQRYRCWRGIQVNAAPTVDLNGAGGGANATYTFTEGDEASYVTTSATISDTDGSTLASITIVGTSFGQDGANEQIEFGTALFPSNADHSTTYTAGSTTFALAYTTADKTLVITKNGGGTFSITDANTLLQLWAYWNQATPPDTTDRTFTVVANDGTDDSAAATLTITVTTLTKSDSFTDANGTTLAAHDANWTGVNATYPVTNGRIQSNIFEHASTFQRTGAYYATSSSDSSSIVIKTGSTALSKRNVAVRMNSNVRGYSATFSARSGGNWTTISIQKDGVFYASKTGSWSEASDHTIKITVSGTTTVAIAVSVDGVDIGAIASDSSSPLAAGHPGFWNAECNAVVDSRLDDWTDAA